METELQIKKSHPNKNLEIPASRARYKFMHNSKDIISYYSLHQLATKQAPAGTRHHLYVLNKSVYVLVASIWEAYCEDLVTESVQLLVEFTPSWNDLPHSLTRVVAKEIRNGQVELAPWALAGDGWRTYLSDRLEYLARRRNFSFASPNSANIEKLFRESLGIDDIAGYWQSKPKSRDVIAQLDAHIERRNKLVHQISPGPTVHKQEVKDFYNLIRRLVKSTDHIADAMLTSVTGQSRWTNLVTEHPIDQDLVSVEEENINA